MYHVYSIQYLNETSLVWEELESSITTDLVLTFHSSKKKHNKGRDPRMITLFIIKSTEDFNVACSTLFEYDTRESLAVVEKERRFAYASGTVTTPNFQLKDEIDKFAESSAERTKKAVSENLDDIINSL